MAGSLEQRRHVGSGSKSIAIANKSGERGQPCLVPLCKLKQSDVTLLVRTEALGAAYTIFIQEINVEPNPNFSKTQNK